MSLLRWPRTSTRSEHGDGRALTWGELALANAETAYGPEHPTIGTRLSTFAGILEDLGDFAAARPLAERALAFTQTAYRPADGVGGVDESP